MTGDRRQSLRVRVEGAMVVDPHGTGQWVPVHDLSRDGFAILSPDAFAIDSLCKCEFRVHDEPGPTLLAQVMRSGPAPKEGENLTGFRFSMVEPDGPERLKQLFDSLGLPAS